MLRPILIVDDNPDDVDILCHGLRRADVTNQLQTFSGGEEVIAHLTDLSVHDPSESWLPVLCVLDVKMPGFHGAEVLSWIREHPGFDAMPVMMCSSSDDPKDVLAARDQGAQCYALKHPGAEDFKQILNRAERYADDRSVVFDVSCNLLLR